MEISTFANVVSRRWDGWLWEILATAAGNLASIEMTKACLNGKQISKGTTGISLGPDIIRARVEALAACDPGLLAEVAQTWVDPESIDPLDSWWVYPWESALRHLKAIGAINKSDVDVPVFSREVDLLWGDIPGSGVTWQTVLAEIRPFKYDLIRKYSRAKPIDPLPTISDIQKGPSPMNRLLQDWIHHLDPTTQDFVAATARQDFSADSFSAESFSAATLSIDRRPDLCFFAAAREIAPEVCAELRDKVAPMVPEYSKLGRRDSFVRLVYLLLGKWRLP